MKFGIDIAAKVGAVNRVLEKREHNGREAHVVIASRSYDTTIEDVWDALTNPERIPRWFLPISGDLKLGGRYQLEGNAGGEITRCEAPRHLEVTWEMMGDVSWVHVTLEEGSNNDTQLRLEHIAHPPEEFWDQFGPGAVGVGWDQGLLGLDLHLTSGASVPPEASEAWVMSDEGKAFVLASSDGWRQASIAAGTDVDAANAAAERTTAFYTGADADGSSDSDPTASDAPSES